MQKYKMPISRLRMMVCLIGMLLPMCMFAQQITVQGVVKDQTGETVIGASVMEKGTTNGTITGIDGDFSLNMSPNGTLVVSFVGYKTQEVQVKGQKQLQVVLSEDAEMLDEVVVIGYGTMKKSDLTGAVSSIGNKDIKDSPVSNLGQAIQGKISGVQIVDAGKPGDNVSIKIRGLGSINNCDPLVVIDGVPTDLGLSSLNMADVERLDVLKDASATAIYGSRGANGVVMITTKRGTEGKGKLAVSANYSFQNATNVPSLLNAAQYAELSNDMMVNSGRNPNPEWANPSELGAGTDWMDELLRTGVMQNYTVSYSGGNEKSHYYVSGGFLDQSGIVKSVNYRRFTFQSNSDAQVLKWLKFSNNITFSADTKKSGSYNIGDALKALPIYPVKNEDGSWSGPDGNSEVPVEEMKVGEKMEREEYVQAFCAGNQMRIQEEAGALEELQRRILDLPYEHANFTSDEVVKLNGVSIRYDDRTILKELDWTVMRGEKWALSGENGAGKSTLLSLVCADNPQSYACDISLFGRKRGTGESIWEIKKHIGYVSPEMHRAYLKNLPAIEIVASGLHDSIGLYKRPHAEQMSVCEWWMDIFGIAALKDKPFLQLSSGEQRLALLARAFVKDPELLILDEPLHGLDTYNCRRVKKIIEAFCHRRDKTMIMVTHYENELPQTITNRLFLKRNR